MEYSAYLEFRQDALKWIEYRLKPTRYIHSLGVEQSAVQLARLYGEDMMAASIAGLLHDNAKNLPLEQQLSICLESFPGLEGFSMDYPSVLHAFAGAAEAKRQYPRLDSDILNAIAFHTTGRPGMSRLEKIIYCADYIEPNRQMFPGLEEARKLVKEDLDKGLLLIMDQTIHFVCDRRKEIYPLTIKADLYYHESIDDKEETQE